jgi:hypothetical protein
MPPGISLKLGIADGRYLADCQDLGFEVGHHRKKPGAFTSVKTST